MKTILLSLLILAACQNVQKPTPVIDTTADAKAPVVNIVEVTYVDNSKDTITMMGKPYLNSTGVLYVTRYKDTLQVATEVATFDYIKSK